MKLRPTLFYLRASRRRVAAQAEARALLAVERNGCGEVCDRTCRDINATIGVSAEERGHLLAFVKAHPEDGEFVREALVFRTMVAREVRRLREAA